MTNPPYDRREDDKNMQVLANRIDNLSDTIGELKHGVNKINEAISKLALIEDRQSQMFLAFDRSAALTDRWMQRQEAHEKACAQQEKELRTLIADSNERLSGRVAELEKAEPMQEQTGKWVMAAVWGAAGLLAMFVAKQLGLV